MIGDKMYEFLRSTKETRLSQKTKNFEPTGKLIAVFKTDDICQVLSILPKAAIGQKRYSYFDTETYKTTGTINEIKRLKNFKG